MPGGLGLNCLASPVNIRDKLLGPRGRHTFHEVLVMKPQHKTVFVTKGVSTEKDLFLIS